MISGRWKIAFFFLLAVFFAAVWLFRKGPAADRQNGAALPTADRVHFPSATQSEREADDEGIQLPPPDPAVGQRALADWEETLRWLRSVPPPSPEEIRARLTAMRVSLAKMDPHELAELIRKLLESGVDATTGLEFKVGPGGMLAGWPTIRVFLLDILAAADPELAAGIARELLDKTGSANEFATALRSLTRDSLGRAENSELLARFDQMLGHPEWQQERGFAEAFDLARAIGSKEAAQRLATWNGDPTLRGLALHEFAAEHPEEIIAALTDQNSTLGGPIGASLMARANPEAPSQVAAVETYLRDPQRSAQEVTEFLKLFPLRSATTGYRLYGGLPTPYSFERVKASDRAALEQVNRWASDPALIKYRAEISDLQKRLTQWTKQAAE